MKNWCRIVEHEKYGQILFRISIDDYGLYYTNIEFNYDDYEFVESIRTSYESSTEDIITEIFKNTTTQQIFTILDELIEEIENF